MIIQGISSYGNDITIQGYSGFITRRTTLLYNTHTFHICSHLEVKANTHKNNEKMINTDILNEKVGLSVQDKSVCLVIHL